MAEILELSTQEFKITIINMLRVLMEKIDNMKGQMGNISWEMETLGKQVIHTQNYLGGLTRRWKNW